jgi:general secretion pathway protein L
MKKITLGLDIGQYAIKGTRIATSLSGRRPASFFEKDIKRDQASDSFHPLSDAQQSILKEWVAEGKILPSDSIAVALPGHLVSTKEISLPFTDPEKIKQTLYFEAEGQLLLDMDEVILDYQTLLSSPDSTRVLVFAASKTMIRTFLDDLLLIGIDPTIVSVDQVALYYYRLWMNQKTPRSGRTTIGENSQGQVVIDLGATKTVLCAMEGNALRWARTTPVGVDLLIEFLQGALQLSWQEAESLVNDLARPGELQKKALAILASGFSPWINDIEVSLKKSESISPVSIHLCGGARISLRAPLSSALHRNIVVQKGLGDVHGEEGGNSSACFALSAGLALLPNHAVNFRKNEFTHSEEIVKGGGLVSIGVAVLLLLTLYIVNLSLHSRAKENKFNLKKVELTSAFQATFPETQNVVDEIKQSESMITDINKRSDLLGIGTQSPLLLLKMITDAIPQGVEIYVSEFTVEGGNVQLEAQTTSFDFVDKIKNALMKVDSFDEVIVGDAKVISDSSRIGFRMQVSVRRLQTAPPAGTIMEGLE